MSTAQTQYTHRYRNTHCKQMTLSISISDMDMLERAAAYAGQSRTAYILQAVRERIERDDIPATDHIDSDI